MPVGDHPSAEQFAAYLDGTLDDAGRGLLDRHLERCAECRAEREALHELAASAPRRNRSLLAPAIVGVAAAAALLFVVMPRRVETPVVRTQAPATAEGIARIAVVAPAAGAALSPGPTVLAWRALGPDADYHAAVLDSVGGVLWSARTADTTATVPAGVLAPGTAFWHVDALRADGRSATSGMIELHVR